MLKYYVKDYIVYIIYNIVLLTLAFVFNRFYQMLIFILFYDLIQNCFRYRFHADTVVENPTKAVKYCKIITIVVEIIYLITCTGLDISIYSNLAIIFLITSTSCILEVSLEYFIIKNDCLKDRTKLLELCKRANLTYSATNRMIMKFIENKSYQEIADMECVDIETIKKSILRSKKKIFKKP